MHPYRFTVPEQKRIRVIVHTDCKNEADDQYALAHIPYWPHGELWGLGDQGCIAVLMQEREQTCDFTMQPAPRFAEDCTYIHETSNREIRVYHNVDSRLTLEDFFCKLALQYGK